MSTSISQSDSSTADTAALQQIDTQIRRWILRSTAEAESGHPTSSLSAVELMTELMFAGTFRYDLDNPANPVNDRLIFSKGHASPLFYALWAAAGHVTEQDLLSYREFGSELEGHPTSRFRFTEAATGSLGHGLSIGLGIALAAKYFDQLPYRSFVLLGDSELAEGSQWEAIQLATHYQLNNLVGILDVNRLGQRGETMYGYDLDAYRQRIEAFGWRCLMVQDGHDHEQIRRAYAEACSDSDRPAMVIARTVKGQGVDFLENENGFHGKPVEPDKMDQALDSLGDVSETPRGKIANPPAVSPPAVDRRSRTPKPASDIDYKTGDEVATRDAYGNAICRLAEEFPDLVVLDGEVCNSTRSKRFRDQFPDRFFEMFVAEQNMAGTAIGLALRGKLPFVSSFAAFLSRAFDQIRMAPYSAANVKFVGSHCGVSIGQDGPSQMGLEDIAMFRSVLDSVVLYPCDAVSTEALVETLARHKGVGYLRTTRGKTPVIYQTDETFEIGGSKTPRSSGQDQVTLVAAGITLHNALEAYTLLLQRGIRARVIDLYSIKPLDHAAVRRAADDTDLVVTIEDHFPEGGIGEAVLTSLADHATPVHCLAVRKRPLSGAAEKQLAAQGLSPEAIAEAVQRAIA